MFSRNEAVANLPKSGASHVTSHAEDQQIGYVIGVLTQKNTLSQNYPYGDTYLFSSYVKYLEQAGAGVVPILMSQEDDYYSNLFNKING
ncbi:Gamma-glutamyl hydrolase B [Lamellibrachia satsuma]|nr:Gamma-glutamyl hydrolase B [Lamellibrachia satsuma]